MANIVKAALVGGKPEPDTGDGQVKLGLDNVQAALDSLNKSYVKALFIVDVSDNRSS